MKLEQALETIEKEIDSVLDIDDSIRKYQKAIILSTYLMPILGKLNNIVNDNKMQEKFQEMINIKGDENNIDFSNIFSRKRF